MKNKNLVVVIMIILTLSLSGSLIAGKSPVKKGNVLVSGGFNFSSSSGDMGTMFGIMPIELYEENMTQIQFNPSFNYFITNRLALGINLFLVSYSFSDSSYSSSISTFGIGPQIYYFFGGSKKGLKIKGSLYPYLGVTYIFNSNKSKYEESYYSDNYTIKGSTFKTMAGMNIMVSESVGIFGEIVYILETWEDSTGKRIDLSIGFKIFL